MPASTIGDLASFQPAVSPDILCEEIAGVFAASPRLYAIAVVDQHGVPVGLLNRFKFLERLSSRFGRALTVTRSVAQFMEQEPLVFDESTPIDRVGELFVASENPYVFDGFIITREGRYVGTATGLDLMRALSERRHSELLRQARHDSLTGLPNRHQFDLNLQEAIGAAAASRARLAVLFIDLDRFKHVNDTFGHGVGDLVLTAIGQRLRANLRRQDTVARLSGDEFAVILEDVTDGASAEMVAAALLQATAAPIHIDGHDIVVSCSIGVAICPDDARTAERLVQASDAAVYSAKQVRNAFQRYRADMTHSVAGSSVDLHELRQAIERGHLAVHYQPKIDLRTDQLCGVEALVRWPHAPRGAVPTDELIRLAEDSGLIASISEFVIRTAMRDIQTIGQTLGRQDLRLAVNISSVQLRHDGLVPMLDRLIAESGFECARLELELTESAAMLAGRSAAATMRALKQRGFVLAIDDFGTGYSSLSQLERMPVDVLKIDKSFIAGVGQVGGHAAITRAIIALGRSLGLTLVGEGVETESQLAFLREEGCHIAQGFLLGRPEPLDRLLEHLTGARAVE